VALGRVERRARLQDREGEQRLRGDRGREEDDCLRRAQSRAERRRVERSRPEEQPECDEERVLGLVEERLAQGEVEDRRQV